MQVAAMSPVYVSPDDVPPEQAQGVAELALLSQPFIKNPSQTIQDIVNERIAKFGENIMVRRFVRYELGA
jgi:elongation factor Ts